MGPKGQKGEDGDRGDRVSDMSVSIMNQLWMMTRD